MQGSTRTYLEKKTGNRDSYSLLIAQGGQSLSSTYAGTYAG
jgi:hypothetical protein